jgi:hypothetical protein
MKRREQIALGVARWWWERGHDSLWWPRQLAREWPLRLRRLRERLQRPPLAREMMPGALYQAHATPAQLFDLVGGLELLQIWLRLLSHTTPLAPEERETVVAVLGEGTLRYDEVRIAEGGWLRLVFRYNGSRAFAIGHTIFLPEKGRADQSLLVHELVHTCQYERLGSRYIGEALYAQRQLGRGCYDYGGAEGLARATEAGRLYGSFNREAQAQIAQDYGRRLGAGQNVAAYEEAMRALRGGEF